MCALVYFWIHIFITDLASKMNVYHELIFASAESRRLSNLGSFLSNPFVYMIFFFSSSIDFFILCNTKWKVEKKKQVSLKRRKNKKIPTAKREFTQSFFSPLLQLTNHLLLLSHPTLDKLARRRRRSLKFSRLFLLY